MRRSISPQRHRHTQVRKAADFCRSAMPRWRCSKKRIAARPAATCIFQPGRPSVKIGSSGASERPKTEQDGESSGTVVGAIGTRLWLKRDPFLSLPRLRLFSAADLVECQLMSSYDAIVPISWSRLTVNVLPAWTSLIDQRITADAFARDLGIRAEPPAGDWDWETDWAAEWHIARQNIPAGYLADLDWSPNMPFAPADSVRRSRLHTTYEATPGGHVDVGSHLLWAAVRAAACVDLTGSDGFDETESFYGRMHSTPHFQVAGSKNGYPFIEAVFSKTWVPDLHIYRYAALPSADPALVALIQGLCLATRAFPGIRVLREGNAWPGYDDLWIQGILTPCEVQELASKLEELCRLVSERNATLEAGWHDTLFPLFADRVTRSADHGLALLTVQSGL